MKKIFILLFLILFNIKNSYGIIDIDKYNTDIQLLTNGKINIIDDIKRLSNNDKNQVLILALNTFHETRGENIDGQIAVISVVLNRVRSKKYPNNIIDVVYQNKQFSWTLKDDRITILNKELKSWKYCQKLAYKMYMNKELITNKICLHYMNKDIVDNIIWTKNFKRRKIIGRHIFLMNS